MLAKRPGRGFSARLLLLRGRTESLRLGADPKLGLLRVLVAEDERRDSGANGSERLGRQLVKVPVCGKADPKAFAVKDLLRVGPRGRPFGGQPAELWRLAWRTSC